MGFHAGLGLAAVARRTLGVQPARMLFRPLHRAIAPHLRLVTSGGAPLATGLARTLEGLGWEGRDGL